MESAGPYQHRYSKTKASNWFKCVEMTNDVSNRLCHSLVLLGEHCVTVLPVFVFQYMSMEQIAIVLPFLFYGVKGKYWARGINTGRWKMDLSADADRSF